MKLKSLYSAEHGKTVIGYMQMETPGKNLLFFFPRQLNLFFVTKILNKGTFAEGRQKLHFEFFFQRAFVRLFKV